MYLLPIIDSRISQTETSGINVVKITKSDCIENMDFNCLILSLTELFCLILFCNSL